jgi:type II secretory pathway component PulJ
MKLNRMPFPFLRRRAALTLLEMMVAVTLLAMIMVGLLAMFHQTQKALHAVNAQSDVFENARGAIQMLSRDLTDMQSFNSPGVTNFHFAETLFAGFDVTLPRSPADIVVSNRFYEAFWLTRGNDEWSGVGYFVDGAATSVGTLYRFSVSGREHSVSNYFPAFLGAAVPGSLSPTVHRVSDGIVNFRIQAVYPQSTGGTNPIVTFVPTTAFDFGTNDLPAYVDVELGVLEPNTLKQVQSIMADPGFDQKVVDSFLREHVGNIHYFRQRVPIRNFLNPYRSNEVP